MRKPILLLILAIALCSAGIAIAGSPKSEPADAQDVYTLSSDDLPEIKEITEVR